MARSETIDVLRSGDARGFIGFRLFSTLGMIVARTSLQWQVFDQTGSTVYLGLIGAAEFVPVLLLGPIAGALSDVHDRKRIVLISVIGETLCGIALWWSSVNGELPLPAMYLAIILMATCFTFEKTASTAFLSTLVPTRQFQSAVTLQNVARGLGWVSGSVIAGFVLAAHSIEACFLIQVAFLSLACVSLSLVVRPDRETAANWTGVRAIAEGFSFVRKTPVIWSAMNIDMFAVLFAGVSVLLPVFAKEILEAGPRGYGVLAGSVQAGQYLMALLLIVHRPIVRPGYALLVSVASFGLATIVFGLSRNLYLSVGALAVAGMADQVSMIARSTVIQLSTPNDLRGRVSSVNTVFTGASNQLGDVESGFLAALVGTTSTVLFGGVVCLALAGLIGSRVPQLRTWNLATSRAEALP